MVEKVHTVRKLSSPRFVQRLSSEKGSKALGLPGCSSRTLSRAHRPQQSWLYEGEKGLGGEPETSRPSPAGSGR